MKKIEKNEKKSCGIIQFGSAPFPNKMRGVGVKCRQKRLLDKYLKGIQIVKNIFFQFFIMSSWVMDTSANTPNTKNANLCVSIWANVSPVTARKSEIQLFLDFLCIRRLLFVRINTCLITLCKAYYQVFLNQINLVFYWM